jgi:hypothetical protein
MRRIILTALLAALVGTAASGIGFDFRTTGTTTTSVIHLRCSTAAPPVSQAYWAKWWIPCTSFSGYTAGTVYISQNGAAYVPLVGGGGSGVSSFATRTGAVTPTSGDYSVGEVTGAAPTASPTFTGNLLGDFAIFGHNVQAGTTVVVGSQVTLAESSASPVMDIDLQPGSIAGGTFSYTVRADDGVDRQALRGRVLFSAVNKAGTITITLGTPEEITSVSAGTLAATVTVVNSGGTAITFKINAVSSLAQTTLDAYVSVESDSDGYVTQR